MTLLDLNSLGYYLSSLSQTRDFKGYACTVRPCSGYWFGTCEGAPSIEEALSAAYEHCREMEIFGRSKRQIKLSFFSEPSKLPQPQISLEGLGLVKPLKRRSLR